MKESVLMLASVSWFFLMPHFKIILFFSLRKLQTIYLMLPSMVKRTPFVVSEVLEITAESLQAKKPKSTLVLRQWFYSTLCKQVLPRTHVACCKDSSDSYSSIDSFNCLYSEHHFLLCRCE